MSDKIWATPFDEDMEGGTYCDASTRPLAPNKDAWCYVRADLVQKWQPIETASGGQETVLLLVDGEVYSGYCMEDGTWWFPFADYHGCGCCSGDKDEPTHWMPLPAPPVTEGEN